MNLSHFYKFLSIYLCKLILSFLLWIIFLTSLSAATFQGGSVTSEIYLNLTHSPFTISENILIEKEASLIIEAGVELRFYPKKGVTVYGSIIAKVSIPVDCFFSFFQKLKLTFFFQFLNYKKNNWLKEFKLTFQNSIFFIKEPYFIQIESFL